MPNRSALVRTATVATVTMGAFAAAGVAEAHRYAVDATCEYVDVSLVDYSTTDGPNTVEIHIDGVAAVDTTFATSYDQRIAFADPTVDHTYRVVVDSPSWAPASFDTGVRTVDGCAPTTTAATTTTTTVTTVPATTTTTLPTAATVPATTSTTTAASGGGGATTTAPGSTTTIAAVQPPRQPATTTAVAGGAGGGTGGVRGSVGGAGTLPATGADTGWSGPLAAVAAILVLAGGTLLAAGARRRG